MTNSNLVPCDGCGQLATSEHIARRLQRLEWATRYRPLHINTVLLSAVSPDLENEFLYSSADTFHGEALTWLAVAGIDPVGKSPEAIHSEFQRAGFYLTYVLECPVEKESEGNAALHSLLEKRIGPTMTRIRRSFKPKRVALVSADLTPFVDKLSAGQLQCGVVLDGEKPFALGAKADNQIVSRLREALAPELGVR